MGRDLIAELAGCEAHAGAGMLQDIADLAAVQFCIGGHHDCSRVPNAEHQLQIVGTILRDDGDAFAGLKQQTVA